MRFIKKLVILYGGRARGTLLLEKNSFGIWGKLSVFDLRPGDYKLIVISGDNVFIKKIDSLDKCEFTLGEMEFEEIHAAIISDKVVMYGSSCAAKLPYDVIMAKFNRLTLETNEDLIAFSGREGRIEDYFKRIAPSPYDDFAIAERNYYPAYVRSGETEESEVKNSNNSGKLYIDNVEVKPKTGQKVVTPHELERRYIQLFEVAATLVDGNIQNAKTEVRPEKGESVGDNSQPTRVPEQSGTPDPTRTPEQPKAFEQVRTSEQSRTFEPPKVSEQSRAPEQMKEPEQTKKATTVAEKPEVIAMARRVTLRDYRMENVKPTGRRATFFERSSAQLDKLMAENERFAPAEKLIPGSKFVKIRYDQKRYYIVGTIGRDYICYGVPAVYSDVPPEPLSGYARWLPFNSAEPRGDGFWMMYQDGVSGETIKAD